MPAPLPILHRDDHLAIVDKPPGLLVHESRIAAREVDTALGRARVVLGCPAWLAHRLDRATSGCLLLGLSKAVMRELNDSFMERMVDKRYLAVVRGWPEEDFAVDHPLDGGPGKRELREARTRFRRLATAELPVPVPPHPSARYALLECMPHTGRYHQIRRHLKHASHHLVGDTTHGDGRHNRVFRQHLGCHRMLLHAWKLSFLHPVTGERIAAAAPPGDEFAAVLTRLAWTDALT